jgi:hypothetical protein
MLQDEEQEEPQGALQQEQSASQHGQSTSQEVSRGAEQNEGSERKVQGSTEQLSVAEPATCSPPGVKTRSRAKNKSNPNNE